MESTIETNSKISINRDATTERNDIVAINMPSDFGNFFVFRMVAKPGDTLRISESQIFINSILQKNPETVQFTYLLEAKKTVDDGFFLERGIKEFMKTQEGYLIYTTEIQASELRKIDFMTSVTKSLKEPGFIDDRMFSDFPNSNQDNMEAIYLPKAGDVMKSDQLSRYTSAILNHEGIDVTGLQEYRFKNSYCFVLGDNRHNAVDSRYIGLIPMVKVMGTVNISP